MYSYSRAEPIILKKLPTYNSTTLDLHYSCIKSHMHAVRKDSVGITKKNSLLYMKTTQ